MKEAQNNDFKSQLISLVTENEELKSKIADYEKLLSKKDEQIDVLEKELSETIEMALNAEEEPSGSQQLIQTMQQQYAHLQVQFLELQDQLKILNDRNTDLQKQTAKVTELRSMIENIRMENKAGLSAKTGK